MKHIGERKAVLLARAMCFIFSLPKLCRPVLEQAALASPIFGTRWRWDAKPRSGAAAISRRQEDSSQIQRMRSDDLLASGFSRT